MPPCSAAFTGFEPAKCPFPLKTVADVSFNAVANLGYANIRFENPVYIGDTISVSSDVIGLRENKNGQSGIVYVKSIAKNQHDEVVLSWNRWVMVHKKDTSVSVETHIPDTLECVDISSLAQLANPNLDYSKLSTQDTGSNFVWDAVQFAAQSCDSWEHSAPAQWTRSVSSVVERYWPRG